MTVTTGFLPGARLVLPGRSGGPLHGLRFAAKDLFDIRGHVTGAGNPDWLGTHDPAPRTAPLIAQALAAGAAFAGKTVTDELAYSLIGDNVHYGAPPNPLAAERFTGGSSSGSASVTAAGLVDFALGTDTAGSIRIPASHCGLFGFRPTHGALSADGIVPLAPSFDVPGWLAGDGRVLVRVGRTLLAQSPPAATRRLRVAIAEAAFSCVGAAHRAGLRSAAMDLARRLGAGSTVSLDQPLPLEDLRGVFRVLQAEEAWRQHGTWIESHAPRMAADVLARFQWGQALGARDLREAHAAASRHRAWVQALFEGADVVVWPTAAEPALPRTCDEQDRDGHRARILQLTAPASLAGLPQVTIPGWDGQRLPVGVSLIAARGGDRLLLDLVACLHGDRGGA